jgi:hypothetical protein
MKRDDEARRSEILKRSRKNEIIKRKKIDAACRADGLYWAQHYSATADEHALDKGTSPTMPFPKLEYFDYLWAAMVQSRRLFIPKSREMMTSWIVAAYCTWLCQYNPSVMCLVQTQNEQKVKRLLMYSKTLYDNQPLFLRMMHPLKGGAISSADLSQSATAQIWDNRSSVVGVPGGAHQVRSYHPSVLVIDEGAHLVEARESYDTAAPVVPKIIDISSAGPGFFQEMCDEDNIDPDGLEEVKAMFAGHTR